MNWIIAVIYAISLITFAIFSSIAVKHAARFRYLSTRTVYLTILFVALTSVLVLISLIAFGVIVTWTG